MKIFERMTSLFTGKRKKKEPIKHIDYFTGKEFIPDENTIYFLKENAEKAREMLMHKQ